MIRGVQIVCDWCQAETSFDTEEDAYESEWMHLEFAGADYDFCSTECLISHL